MKRGRYNHSFIPYKDGDAYRDWQYWEAMTPKARRGKWREWCYPSPGKSCSTGEGFLTQAVDIDRGMQLLPKPCLSGVGHHIP